MCRLLFVVYAGRDLRAGEILLAAYGNCFGSLDSGIRMIPTVAQGWRKVGFSEVVTRAGLDIFDKQLISILSDHSQCIFGHGKLQYSALTKQ